MFPCFSSAGAAEPQQPAAGPQLRAGPPPKPLSPVEELNAVEREEQTANGLEPGKHYFLISRRWHVEWLQWVGHHSTRSPKTGPWPAPLDPGAGSADQPLPRSAAAEGAADRPRSLSAEDAFDTQERVQRERSWTKERPGPIDNSGLLDSGRPGKLRGNIGEHGDYEIISEGVWTLLHSWYDGGPPIKRRAISQPSGSVVLELYGLTLKVYTSTNISAPPTTMMESKTATVAAFKKRACEELGLEEANCRVWDYFNRRKYKNLEEAGNIQKTLDDNQIYEENDILVEVKLADGSWPPEEEPSKMSSVGVEDVPTSGRPPQRGAVGLTNLGNTCFMNSSLQCLSSVPGMREYFLDERYKEELNESAYKTNGKLAQATARLFTQMWDPNTTSVAPRAFKWQIGQFAEQFAGYGQQDSMEFIEYLLDGLKEDVNRVKGQKPFVETKEAEGRPDDVVAAEARENYRQRNNSHIDDMFLGFFKSTVTCPEPGCGRVSVTFDPYLSVKLSLVSASEERTASFHVLAVPMTGFPNSAWHKVSVAKFGDAQEIIRNAAASANLDAKNCVLAEIITFEKIYKFFEPSDAVDKIGSSDVLVMYELENAEEFHIPYEERWGRQDDAQADGASQDGEKCSVVIYQRQMKASQSSWSSSSSPVFVGIPLATCVKKRTTGEALVEEVQRELRRHMPKAAEKGSWRLFRTGDKWNVGTTDKVVENDSTELIFTNRQYLVVEWKEGEEVKEADEMKERLEEAPNANSGKRGGSQHGAITLERCFQMFTETDRLPPSDAWYCNRCKEHREANKKMEFWSFPPVLVLQMKRFTYSQYSRERLDTPVIFPMDGLDLSSYCPGGAAPQAPQVYDLASVSIHMGGLGGGHYVAFARSSENGKWYDFNDSRVSEVPASQVLSEQTGAYVLFYIRRDQRPAAWGLPPPSSAGEPSAAPSTEV